jgi:hypothetical protein
MYLNDAGRTSGALRRPNKSKDEPGAVPQLLPNFILF